MLQNFFNPDHLIFDLRCRDKHEAITLLVNRLVEKQGFEVSPQKLIEEFMRREKKGSTGLQNGIAVPHIKVEFLSRFHLAVGLHHQGLDFNAIDGKPTHIIFLLIAPLSESNTHLAFLSRMSRLFLNRELSEKILKEKSAQKVCELFAEMFHE